MTAVTEQIAAAIVLQRPAKKLTPRQRTLPKQYRDELFAEYAEGNMMPEKKAMVLDILGPDFFAPVDKRKAQFEHHLENAAAYYADRAQRKARCKVSSAKVVTA